MNKDLSRRPIRKRLLLSGFVFPCFFIFLITGVPSLGQEPGNGKNVTINGTVTDTTGLPLIGAAVVIEGTESGTVTDQEGKYEISVPQGSTLTFCYIGFEPRQVEIGDQSTINVTLTEEIEALEEVVVIGYGTQTRSDLTGSVAQVSSREINAFPSTNLLQSLSGRASGVRVSQTTGAPGGGLNVRIRGTNSIQGSNEPLYVVDGFPIFGNNPTVLNNSDIASIEILKDASATAIYGSRGANGVVLI